ncbi:MAG: hypothetical protein JNL96_22160 [Planctomycetaceae bacterium]|nr:hypothetical protein [Planctomycetaceae bacterium]
MISSRLAVMLLGPVPIVAASLALTQWWRPGGNGVISGNHVLHADEPLRNAKSDSERHAKIADDLKNRLVADCEATAAELKPRLGGECSVIVRVPFVIAGDMDESQLSIWYTRTIAPAARSLGNAYFRTSPSTPITVLLFNGERSYDCYAEALFGDQGISVYGYYKPERRTLVMNIATGGGTLIHELTHALIDFDFPHVPDWFNEGLASLYEQSRFLPNEGELEGLPNWRLPSLQEAVARNRLGSLEALFATDDFRGVNVGLNYAQARYFCLYLQEQKLLAEFYHRFRASHDKDPQGSAAAKSLFPEKSWEQIDRDYQEFVTSLQQPR